VSKEVLKRFTAKIDKVDKRLTAKMDKNRHTHNLGDHYTEDRAAIRTKSSSIIAKLSELEKKLAKQSAT
jgi:predicted transcriptional regulator